ncbi:MAG: Sulfoxide reductase catalytic subunit YedY [Verrucomicrobia subdivision 3 bacterium]|nr:Sulfoxide reductase catalytic subunit YedY [Limisphaerales bacterium]MCS1414135.1 Sulfoxide reductase catalytic subunit YedY [Limisphaerales bacterium]
MPLIPKGSFGHVNQDYIARKERWVQKMAGKKLDRKAVGGRLPPGQHEVKDFPVLDIGLHPEVPLEAWTLHIHGHVENPVKLSWADFMDLPQFTDVSDFHCVTTWSQFEMEWQGVAFFTIAELVKPKPEAKHIFFKSHDGYSTNNPVQTCLDEDVLIAHSWNGRRLTKKHGGPARVIIPKRYAWKGAKFIREIVFLDRDILGFWELRGYSNTADPWSDDRFAESKSP